MLLVGRAWVDERLPPGCCCPAGLARLLRAAGRRDGFAPTWQDRTDPAWDRFAAASTCLHDRWQHAAMVNLLTGARPRLAGAGLALAAGAALGFALAA